MPAVTNVAPMTVEPDAPPSRRSKLGAVGWVGVVVVIVLVAALAVAVTRGDGGSSAATGDGAIAETPNLQDLADIAQDTPESDDAAPDFSVRTHDGGAFTLSKHLAEDGRPVILNLWASWCFPCREEMPAIDRFAAANPDVMVVGVAVQDDAVAAADFADELGVSYTIGFDEKDEVNVAYRPLGLPATFFISSDGIIVKRVFGGVTEESLAQDVAELFG